MTLLLETDEQLGQRDIALTNLYAARGLPGSESIDIPECLRTLDAWAARAAQETKRCWNHYDRAPRAHNNSRNRFRILVMVTVLQRDLGVHYPQELKDMPDVEYFKRSGHLFIHGVVRSRGGTCTSLPVVFAAVGRRLGYPIKLAKAWRHLYARWEDPGGERFNIECTSLGFVSKPDEYYRQMMKDRGAPEHAGQEEYYRSLTPREEAAGFFGLRGLCAERNDHYRVAVRAYAQAAELDGSPSSARVLEGTLKAWEKRLKSLCRPGFPVMSLYFPPRCYPSLPLEMERKIVRLETLEQVLSHPAANERWWEPLRRDPSVRPANLPACIEVAYPYRPGGEVRVRYLDAVPPAADPSKREPW